MIGVSVCIDVCLCAVWYVMSVNDVVIGGRVGERRSDVHGDILDLLRYDTVR